MDMTTLISLDEQLDDLRNQLDEANTSWERGNLIEEIEELMELRSEEISNCLLYTSPSPRDS